MFGSLFVRGGGQSDMRLIENIELGHVAGLRVQQRIHGFIRVDGDAKVLQRGFDAVAFGGERHRGVIQPLLHSIRKFFAGLAHDRDIAQMNTGRSLVLEVPTSDEEIGY